MLRTKEQLKQILESNRIINDNGCWIWTKAKTKSGYGQISMGGGHIQQREYVHRVAAWIYLDISLKDKNDVCHNDNKCKSKACFNPDHIFKGNRSINMKSAFRNKKCRS